MSTVNSTQYQAQYGGSMALDPGVINSGLKVMSAEYEASALAANDVINVIKMPIGAVIHDLIVDFDDLGTGTTLDVGDSADADRYIDGADTATAAGTARLSAIAGRGYRIGTATGDNIIQAKNLGAAATGTIKFTVVYAV